MRTTVLICALLTGCGPSMQSDAGEEVRLRVEPDPVAADDSVTLILHNESPAPVGYNLCTSQLERRTDGEWMPVPSDRVCTMELRILGPGEEARYRLELGQDVSSRIGAGEYRFLTRVERQDDGSMADVASPGFRVSG